MVDCVYYVDFHCDYFVAVYYNLFIGTENWIQAGISDGSTPLLIKSSMVTASDGNTLYYGLNIWNTSWN